MTKRTAKSRIPHGKTYEDVVRFSGTVVLQSGPRTDSYAPRHPVDEKCGRFLTRHWAMTPARTDPLYAIPKGLLTALEQYVAGFLTEKERALERELTDFCDAHGAAGIVEGTFISGMLLGRAGKMPIPEAALDPRAATDPAVKARVRSGIDAARSALGELQETNLPYLGWLLTNPAYLSDLARLREHRQARVPWRSFMLAVGERDDPLLREFLGNWQLTKMLTWDLPIPQGPNLTFCPWPASVHQGPYLMPSIPLTAGPAVGRLLQKILPEVQRSRVPSHLADWIDVLGRRGKKRGLTHYDHIFAVHFYLSLVLGRYADRVGRQIEKMDNALADFLFLSPDSIKKIRLAVKRRLPKRGKNPTPGAAAP